MNEQWQELKETIIELRDGDGTGTQQEVCKFLVNYMGILKKQMQEPVVSKQAGHWLHGKINNECWDECSECHVECAYLTLYCPNCGAKMIEPQEREEV